MCLVRADASDSCCQVDDDIRGGIGDRPVYSLTTAQILLLATWDHDRLIPSLAQFLYYPRTEKPRPTRHHKALARPESHHDGFLLEFLLCIVIEGVTAEDH